LDLTSESTVSDAASLSFSDEAREDMMPDGAVLAFSDHVFGATIPDDDLLAFPEHDLGRPCSDAAVICLPDASHGPSCERNGWEDNDKLAEQQLQNEHLSKQRTDAMTMFAENGDTSGLLAVMAAASKSSVFWDPSGMPRF
jgi:hypothetical protein